MPSGKLCSICDDPFALTDVANRFANTGDVANTAAAWRRRALPWFDKLPLSTVRRC